jgi:hypothetical protein
MGTGILQVTYSTTCHSPQLIRYSAKVFKSWIIDSRLHIIQNFFQLGLNIPFKFLKQMKVNNSFLILKSSDNGVQHSRLLRFWTLSTVWYS